jgi:hypothetical protein
LNKRARESNACFRTAHHQRTRVAMIRFVLRFIGLFLLATAFVFFVYDGTKSIANHQFVYTKVGDVWAIVDQNSLNFVQDWLKQKALWMWDPYIQKIFDLPTWVVLGIVATILILLGRKKKPLIGYARD